MPLKIIIASQNEHKISEIAPLLTAAGFDVSDARFHELPEPVEDGGSFIANARIKAHAAVKATGTAVLADDSGLIIDALGDFPGVDTAPYAKECGGYPQAVEDLLKRLDGREATCYYISTLVLAFPGDKELVAEAKVHGRLIKDRRGDGQFGFDPWFEIENTDKTFAELTFEQKNRHSHRGKALADLLQQLKDLR